MIADSSTRSLKFDAMLLQMLKSKLHMAAVTRTELTYHGSITVPQDLLDAVGLLPYEHVLVANVNTGQRGETYTIPGKAGSGDIQLNGAMARLAQPGDRVIILAFAQMTPEEARTHKPKVAILDGRNKITDQWEG